MSLLWNIGSAYFCKDGDADTYQSVHLTMVGFRAVFAPIFGIWLYHYILVVASVLQHPRQESSRVSREVLSIDVFKFNH